jgi:hypothetical protein
VWNQARRIPFVATLPIGEMAEGGGTVEQHFRLQQELAKRGIEPSASDVAKRSCITDDVALEDVHFADDDDELVPPQPRRLPSEYG